MINMFENIFDLVQLITIGFHQFYISGISGSSNSRKMVTELVTAATISHGCDDS